MITIIITLLPLIKYTMYFALGYQTCKLIRKWKDDEAMEELHRLILEKIKENDALKDTNASNNVKIDSEGN